MNSKSEFAYLTHEDTITIKDLDDAYAAATDELIAGVDEAHFSDAYLHTRFYAFGIFQIVNVVVMVNV